MRLVGLIPVRLPVGRGNAPIAMSGAGQRQPPATKPTIPTNRNASNMPNPEAGTDLLLSHWLLLVGAGGGLHAYIKWDPQSHSRVSITPGANHISKHLLNETQEFLALRLR